MHLPSSERTSVLATTAAVLTAAAVVRALSWMHDDVSWFLIVAERVLGGARAYIDFVDGNPPAAFLAYMPAILIAQATHLRPEAAITILVFIGALASVWLSGKILLRANLIKYRDAPALVGFSLFCLLIAPGNTFAQREHLSLVALLPMLAVYSARAAGRAVLPYAALIAGVAGGIAATFKPYFLLPIAFAFLVVAARRRPSARSLLHLFVAPEGIGAAVLLAAYAGLCAIAFPDYFERAVPLALDLYTRFRFPFDRMVVSFPSVFMAAGFVVCAFAWGRRLWSHPALIFAAASIGFALCVFLQAKGYPYQSAPSLLLLVFVTGWGLAERYRLVSSEAESADHPSRASEAVVLVLYLAACTADMMYFGFSFHPPSLASEIARVAPPHPRIAAITETLKGPELAEILGGTWVERTPSSWIGMYAAGLDSDGTYRFVTPPDRAKIALYNRLDRDFFVEAIAEGRPDVIFADPVAFSRKRLADPKVAATMRDYRRIPDFQGEEIWLRTLQHGLRIR
jgi:hypothetical protein